MSEVKRLFRCLIFLSLMALVLPFGQATEAKRLALVIGNDAYQHLGKLEKAVNDAVAMSRELKAAGFEVELQRDLSYRKMSKTIDAFAARIRGGDQVVVFYAGHGVQIKSGNYLLPIDLEKGTESEIERFSYSLDDLTAKLAEAKASFSLVVIDACRNNPIKVAGRSIGASRGLSPVEPPRGQMVVFSASRGQEALDKLSEKDNNPNGVFTREFIARMKSPGIKIQDLMVDVQDAVETLAKTVEHEQRPAVYNESRGSFYFYGAGSSKIILNNTPAIDPETETWNAAVSTNSIKAYQAYLNAFPNGKYAAAASIKVEALQVNITTAITQSKNNIDNESAFWIAVDQKMTVDGYQKYLQNYPNGKFVGLANQRLQKLLSQTVEQKITDTSDVSNRKEFGYSVAFVNSLELIRRIGDAKETQQEVIEKANKIIKDISVKNSIPLVLQDYLWVSPQLDISEVVIKQIQSGNSVSQSLGSLPKVKFAYLNKANLLVMKDLRAGYRDEAAFLQAVTNAAFSLSGQLGFNAVVTEAVWVDANINITNLIVDELRGISIDYSFNKNKFNVSKDLTLV